MAQELQLSGSVDFIPISLDLASHAARYRVGLNLATVDALNFTTFLEANCYLVLTTDSDLAQAQVKNLISVELLT